MALSAQSTRECYSSVVYVFFISWIHSWYDKCKSKKVQNSVNELLLYSSFDALVFNECHRCNISMSI